MKTKTKTLPIPCLLEERKKEEEEEEEKNRAYKKDRAYKKEWESLQAQGRR